MAEDSRIATNKPEIIQNTEIIDSEWVPKAWVAIYGRQHVLQYECLACGDLFFSVVPLPRCSGCVVEDREPLPQNVSQHRPKHLERLDVVGAIIKSDVSQKRNHRNFNKVFKRDNYICRYCNYDPRRHEPLIPLHVDHIIPFSAGGNNSMGNLVVACMDCNQIATNKVFSCYFDKKAFIRRKRERKQFPIYPYPR